jgi:hypothetical protein
MMVAFLQWMKFDVTVYNPPAPFFLGPDTALCDGEVLQYNFDPALGNFTWQNGWNNSYLIPSATKVLML